MIKVLDCTLRDGGYVNDWNFTRASYDRIVEGLQKTDVDFIELGLIGKHNDERFKTKFSGMDVIPSIARTVGSKSLFAVMVTYGEAKDIPISERREGGVDAIRLAYFKPEMDVALEMARELQAKGYLVFLQAMATFLYTDEELVRMIHKVNEVCPYFFCMVDSFGVMYADDVAHMFSLIHKELVPAIGLGFHAHNNQQLALSNVITFMDAAKDTSRLLCVDASIYGMGRGAGNVNLELLLQYLNTHYHTTYDMESVLQIWQEELSDIYNKDYWGYTWEYALAAKYEVNSAYIWYLKNKGITDFQSIRDILCALPYEDRYTLRKTVVDSLIDTMRQR